MDRKVVVIFEVVAVVTSPHNYKVQCGVAKCNVIVVVVEVKLMLLKL